MDPMNHKLVFREMPIFAWVMGVVFLVVAIANLVPSAIAAGTPALIIRGVLLLIGLALLVLPSVLTVTADRSEGMLTLQHRSLVKETKHEIRFAEIEAIQMEIHQDRSHSSDRSGPSYRIVVVKRNGDVIPFRQYYSGGSSGKSRRIRQLREFIGVGGSDMGMGLMGTLREVTKMAQRELQKQQEALTGSQEEVHVTEDVHWQVQTVAFGGSPVTRWFSPDYQLGSGFIYITQLVQGQKASSGGLLGGLSSLVYKQTMAMYGFGQEDTPGIEQASLLSEVDPALASFSVFTSNPDSVYRVLNSQVVAALADWARRYPLHTLQTGKVFSQLVVMVSPKGVYVGSMGTMIPEAIEEMTRLGVTLVKTQDVLLRSLPR